MIYDIFKMSGDMEFRDIYIEVPFKDDSAQAFGTKWDEVLSAVTDSLADNILESLFKLLVEKSQALKYVLQVCGAEMTIGEKNTTITD